MFRHDADPGRSFPIAAGHNFPFLEIDLLHFRDRGELAHQRDVFKTLSKDEEVSKLLNKDLLDGDRNETFADDLSWREVHRAEDRDFWILSTPDVPLELSEHLGFHNHDGPKRPAGLDGGMDSSVLARKSKQFDEAQLVVAPFRCFHRKDGMLLTMSAATGVDQIHKSFEVNIKEPLQERLLNQDASVIGSMMQWLQDGGATGWHDTSVEWFMIYLVTEIAMAPTNMSSGRAMPSMLSVLQGAVLDLKDRRFNEWQRDETPKLVKDYITCVDSLKLLSLSYERKLGFLTRLTADLHNHNKEDSETSFTSGNMERVVHRRQSSSYVRDEDANTAIERVKWAESVVKDEKAAVDFLSKDVNQALEALFQLRTIEQNERTITTDLQNKAFFIFATVTVVFLPVSVFTSYYGMNLVDVRNTEWTQREFWRTLGTAAIAIVALIAVVVTNYYSLYKWLRSGGLRRALQRNRQGRIGSIA